MFNFFRSFFFLIISVFLLAACSDSEPPQEKVVAVPEEKAVQLPVEVEVMPVEESVSETVEETTDEVVKEVQEEAEVVATEAVSGDKPYQLVDGVISANAIEGWKTYNGGGCGACHGKGGIGAVGPNLAQSVKQKLSKEEFVDIVTNGKSGTMMRPHNTNTRVMENMDNLYAYLVARGDDVLGSENLIKFPLGKKE